ncbi:hypothetical protein [Streptomyces sp. NPDC004726]
MAPSGDVPDLLFRGDAAGRGLRPRHGKPGAGGGADLDSLSTAAKSGTGRDEVYGTTGWDDASIPMTQGNPDANGDGISDLWAVMSDGILQLGVFP